MNGFRTTAALLVASCVLTGPAVADPKDREPKSSSDKESKQAASELVKKAIGRSQAGDHSAAIEAYLQAYTLVPNAILLSNIGSEFQQQGKHKEALRYFCMYLEKDPNGTNVPYATTQVRQLQTMMGNQVDDDDVCAVPKRRPAPAPTEEDPGEPGKHGPKAAPAAGATADEAPDDNSTMRYAGIATGAVGVVGLSLGIYWGVKAKDISDELSNHKTGEPWPADTRQKESDGKTYDHLQIAGLAIGGVAVGVGIYLYVHSLSAGESSSSDKPKKDDRVVHVTPTTNGVAVFGRF